MLSRIIIFLLNIFAPPIAVLLITGPNTDFIINCVFFLLAIIPSHVHGMYISFTYFNRRRKVRAGRLPGKRRGGIYSERVQNGGASSAEIRDLEARREGEVVEREAVKQAKRAERREKIGL